MEIGRTAVIRGRVSARTVAIAKGAIVDGEIEVTSGAPVVELEDKRERKMSPPPQLFAIGDNAGLFCVFARIPSS